MKFNELTFNISVGILGVTALYTLVYSGLTGVLLCSSIALIAAAFLNQFELIVAVSIIFALFYTFFLKRLLRKFEPFQDLKGEDSAAGILDRVALMKDKYHPVKQNLVNHRREPAGVYDPAVEGFEDVQPQVPKDGESAESSSASSKRANEVDPQHVQDVTSTLKKSDSDKVAKEEFKSATNGLFKLGEMPSEHKDGPILDSGSTLLKAMNNFKPDQVNAMTSDTKQLLETQKNLMGMLKQMQPVLQDGKELLNTFSGMFGGSGGIFKS